MLVDYSIYSTLF